MSGNGDIQKDIRELQQKVEFLEKELSLYKTKYRNAIDNNEYRSKYRNLIDTYHKNQKWKQQDLTELNGDGNRERGRYGEDLSSSHIKATPEDLEKEHPFPFWVHYCAVESTMMGVGRGEPCNWCCLSEEDYNNT